MSAKDQWLCEDHLPFQSTSKSSTQTVNMPLTRISPQLHQQHQWGSCRSLDSMRMITWALNIPSPGCTYSMRKIFLSSLSSSSHTYDLSGCHISAWSTQRSNIVTQPWNVFFVTLRVNKSVHSLCERPYKLWPSWFSPPPLLMVP